MALRISKISGVVRIATDDAVPRIFFTTIGKCVPQPNGTEILIQIGGDSYTVPYTELRVGTSGQTPSSMLTAITLLNSIFGT